MYVALSWRADENGISWARQALLAAEAGMGRTKAQEVLGSLEAKGLVKSMPWANGKGRSSNVYAVRVWAEPVLSDDTVKRSDGHAMSGRKSPDQAERSDATPPHGVTNAATRQSAARHTAKAPSDGGSARHTGIPMPATRAAEVEPVEEDKQPPIQTLKERMAAARDRGETASKFFREIRENLGYLPPVSDLVKAEKQWTWAHGGWRSVEIARDYVMHCRKQNWTPNDEGWWNAMEFEDRRRAKAPRKMYGPDGVPQ